MWTTTSIITQQTEDTQTGHGLSHGRERHRKFFKWYYAGAAGIIVLAARCILIFIKFHNNTSRVQDVRSSFNKEYYKDSPFSKKQVTELEKEYKSSYDDEMKALDAYILAYMKNYDEYGDIKEEFENLTGITEKFYQAVNEYDPEVTCSHHLRSGGFSLKNTNVFSINELTPSARRFSRMMFHSYLGYFTHRRKLGFRIFGFSVQPSISSCQCTDHYT